MTTQNRDQTTAIYWLASGNKAPLWEDVKPVFIPRIGDTVQSHWETIAQYTVTDVEYVFMWPEPNGNENVDAKLAQIGIMLELQVE